MLSPRSSHSRSVSAQGGVNGPECPLVPPGEAPGPRQGSGPGWARSPQPGRMTDACGGGEHAAAPASSLDASDPELHYEEEEEEEEDNKLEPSDTSSILSDDSVYPCYELSVGAGAAGDLSLYQCCIRNDAKLVQERLERGVTRSEAMELDINGRVSVRGGSLWSRRGISQEQANPEGWWLLKQRGHGGRSWAGWLWQGADLLGLIQSLEQNLGCPPTLSPSGLGWGEQWGAHGEHRGGEEGAAPAPVLRAAPSPERADGRLLQGLRGHRAPAAEVPLHKRQPAGQGREHGPHDGCPGRWAPRAASARGSPRQPPREATGPPALPLQNPKTSRGGSRRARRCHPPSLSFRVVLAAF